MNFGRAVGIIPTARSEFCPPLQVPLAKRGGTAHGFSSPCEQGEPKGGSLHSHLFLQTMAAGLVLLRLRDQRLQGKVMNLQPL